MLCLRKFTMVFAICMVALDVNLAMAGTLPMLDEKRGVLTIAPVLENVAPGVVNISVKTKAAVQQNPLLDDPFFRRFFSVPEQPSERQSISAGSGVIVDAAKGYVLSNHHVIKNAASINVTLKDQRQFEAVLVGSDPGTDIALLKINPKDLTAVSFGNSEAIKVGDYVIAIGNPFGIGQTVTSGIVSALGRSGLGIEGYEDFIQTDASINPGNSGGALINSSGELIGINTAIIGPGGGNVGIGFAVPSNMAKAVMDQLVRFGEVRRGRLGVAVQDLTPDIARALDLAENAGAIVTRVEKNSPAAKSDLKAGDVIVEVDGRVVRSSSDLRNRIGLVPKGEGVTLKFIRDGKYHEIEVAVGDIPVAELSGDDAVSEFAGAVFRDIPADHKLAKKQKGVLIASVERGSPAWQYGLRSDDVVVAVNRIEIASLSDFTLALERAKSVIALNVVRDGRGVFIVVQR